MRTWKTGLLILAVSALLFACTKRISKENYDKISSGMTYQEVEKILGEPTKTTQIGIGELSTTTASWESHDGNIVIQFFNDQVKIKNFHAHGEEHIEVQ